MQVKLEIKELPIWKQKVNNGKKMQEVLNQLLTMLLLQTLKKLNH